MDNTLSDVNFGGENTDVMSALVIGGVALGCGVVGYVVKSLFSNKAANEAISEVAKLRASGNETASRLNTLIASLKPQPQAQASPAQASA